MSNLEVMFLGMTCYWRFLRYLFRAYLKKIFWPPAFERDWSLVLNPRNTGLFLQFKTQLYRDSCPPGGLKQNPFLRGLLLISVIKEISLSGIVKRKGGHNST
jgi:hypothetical protein